MPLVIFRSPAASEIVMLPETAQRLLELIGKPMAERGVISREQVGDAVTRLESAVEREKESGEPPPADDDSPHARQVTLRQRAFPLLEMLRAARKRDVDVTWGI